MTFGREAVVDGEDGVARRSEEVGYLGFADDLELARKRQKELER